MCQMMEIRQLEVTSVSSKVVGDRGGGGVQTEPREVQYIQYCVLTFWVVGGVPGRQTHSSRQSIHIQGVVPLQLPAALNGSQRPVALPRGGTLRFLIDFRKERLHRFAGAGSIGFCVGMDGGGMSLPAIAVSKEAYCGKRQRQLAESSEPVVLWK